jgi:hypothetical protein
MKSVLARARHAAARGSSIVLVTALSWVPGVALAAPTPLDKASAQSLFEDALKLMAAKSFSEACPKLEESQRLDPGMGTEYRLAECYEALGRTASAWAGFSEVADLARASGQHDREKTARDRAALLEAKLSRLVVSVTAPDTQGLEVRRGDVVVGKGQWGSAVPVDPATYTLTATAPGKKPWTGNVDVAGEKAQATLTVPALEDAPVAISSPPVAPAPASPPPPAPQESSPGGGRRVIGIAVAGAGVLGMGTSVALGLVAKNQYDGAGSHCQGSVCDASGKQTTDGARGLANVATVVFAVGAVAAVGGVVVWLTAPSGNGSTGARAGVRLGPGSAFLEGSF